MEKDNGRDGGWGEGMGETEGQRKKELTQL